MKKLTLMLLFLGVGMASASSQNIALRGYTELTHVSPKQGALFTFQNADGFRVGAFYQREITEPNVELEGLAKKMHEVSFAGLYMSFPCYEKKRISIDFEVRTGLKNGKHFSITPSLQGELALSDRIALTAGVGTRNFNPTLIAGTSFRLSK